MTTYEGYSVQFLKSLISSFNKQLPVFAQGVEVGAESAIEIQFRSFESGVSNH